MSEGKRKGRGKGKNAPGRKAPSQSPRKKDDDSANPGTPADIALQDSELFRQYVMQVANSNQALEAAKTGLAARDARIVELEGLPAIVAAGFREFGRQASAKHFVSQYESLARQEFGRISVSEAAKAAPFEDFIKRLSRSSKVAAALSQYTPVLKMLYECRARSSAHQFNSEETLKAARQEYAVPMGKILKIDDFAKMRAEEPEKYQKLVASLPESWQKIVERMDLDAVAEALEDAEPSEAKPAEPGKDAAKAVDAVPASPAVPPAAEEAKPAADANKPAEDQLKQREKELEAMLKQAEEKANAGGNAACSEFAALYREMLANLRAQVAHNDNVYKAMLDMQAGLYQAMLSFSQGGSRQYPGASPDGQPPKGNGYKGSEPAEAGATSPAAEEKPEETAEPPEDEAEAPKSIDDSVKDGAAQDGSKPKGKGAKPDGNEQGEDIESAKRRLYEELNKAYETAKEARKQGDYTGAMSILTQILSHEEAYEAFERKDLLFCEFGVNQAMLGNYKSAEAAFRRVLEINPSEDSAIIASHNLNVIYSSIGNNEEAAKFRRAEKGDSRLYYHEFVTGAQLGSIDEAVSEAA